MALRGDERRVVDVRLAALGLLDERGWRLEAPALARRQLAGARDEAGQAALVAVNVLDPAPGPAREADAEDRADVRVGDRHDHPLVQALDRLDRLDEQHPLLEVAQVDLRGVADDRERVAQPAPQPRAPAVLVLVEPGALEATRPRELV